MKATPEFEARVSPKTNDELLEIIRKPYDWQPAMLDAAKAELRHRHVDFGDAVLAGQEQVAARVSVPQPLLLEFFGVMWCLLGVLPGLGVLRLAYSLMDSAPFYALGAVAGGIWGVRGIFFNPGYGLMKGDSLASLLAALKDGKEGNRVHGARRLRRLDPAYRSFAVPALVDVLRDESSQRLASEVCTTLSHLTGENFGRDTKEWIEWYARTKEND
jgi:hypothetical protein